eukprot:CAMPEP_0185001840 /NCGR_PEP_ID=MMETSP1098-20130426/72211_1 /TAXON_ID=89044 /ORGANISM="Spumella elongata, Strain CCAP 955/1" /LENGTH=109 /DNA_ID=CAMNT_0027529209 /DNA_START=63 /DNA_END=389 /DNA_ORIENTATION=-
MPKILRPGKVVIVLRGRFAGRKAVVLNTNQGNESRPYGHAVVAGVDRYPLKVAKTMGKKKISKRIRIKPFLRTLNYNHVMPTRYAFEVDKSLGVTSVSANKDKRIAVRK